MHYETCWEALPSLPRMTYLNGQATIQDVEVQLKDDEIIFKYRIKSFSTVNKGGKRFFIVD